MREVLGLDVTDRVNPDDELNAKIMGNAVDGYRVTLYDGTWHGDSTRDWCVDRVDRVLWAAALVETESGLEIDRLEQRNRLG